MRSTLLNRSCRLNRQFRLNINKMKRPPIPTFPEDDAYRQQLLADAGLPPEQHKRIRSIIGPSEIQTIVRTFQKSMTFYQPGIRPPELRHQKDTHGLENVKARTFRANLHIHTRHSDGRLSIPQLLYQASAYANSVAEVITKDTPAPFAPFTIGIMDHNRVEGCAEAIRLIWESPRRYRNLRVILGSEVTVRIHRIYDFQLREKRGVHFLLTGITPESEPIRELLRPFANVPRPTRHTYTQSPSVSLTQIAQMFEVQKFGSLSMAHPSRIQLQKFLCKPECTTEAMRQYIHLFHEILGKRALYVEAFYQAYSRNLALNVQELRTILETTAAERLLVAGGMDTHGANIFYNTASPAFQI